MHFFISLIIFCGFAFVAGLGLAQVIWDLSEMSAHTSPNISTSPNSGAGRTEREQASVNESSGAADLGKS
jgi:hypothetical protein